MSETVVSYNTGRPRIDWDAHTSALEALAAQLTGQKKGSNMIEYLVYDIEIIKAIPDKNQPNRSGIQYCAGWLDYPHMGISVICAYDALEDRFRVFCEDNFPEFQQLLEFRRPLITFNGIGFDDKVLTANRFTVPTGKSVDLLREIWKAAGLGPEYQYLTHAGYSLDAVCKANGLPKKTGYSALAPIAWQQGKIGSVIDYCLNDVRLTRDLYRAIVHQGFLIDPTNGESLTIRIPA